jgi:hypothetical protein
MFFIFIKQMTERKKSSCLNYPMEESHVFTVTRRLIMFVLQIDIIEIRIGIIEIRIWYLSRQPQVSRVPRVSQVEKLD